ncbi:MAG: LVIVD repeat-containing protein [Candidatus Dormibacteria bacterium]
MDAGIGGNRGVLPIGRVIRAGIFSVLVTGALAGLAVPSLRPTAAAAGGYYQSIPQAKCGAGSNPETGFQGEVPAALRAAGFQGFKCNLELVGQSQGEGASWQNAWYGKCDYYDTANNQGQAGTGVGAQQHPGTVVLDVSDPAHPTPTAYLATAAMLHPWESLKVNERRALLAGHLTGGAPLDIYDISQDCAHPKLLSSVPMPNNGHEGEWSPDGLTYWGSSTSEYHAIDVADPTHPKQLLTWTTPAGTTHGMSFSPDGTRAYFTQMGSGPSSPVDGLVIADVSDIQYRRANPQIRIISRVTWPDGSYAQHTIPVFYGGHPYLIFVDELGSGGLGTAATRNYSCGASLPPYGHPRIFDISDEKNPRQVASLTLQTDDPANCAVANQETSGQVIFGYDSHYCAVDHHSDPTAMACGYFNSGIRVFDIRNPADPKEIAYYNPPRKWQRRRCCADRSTLRSAPSMPTGALLRCASSRTRQASGPSARTTVS